MVQKKMWEIKYGKKVLLLVALEKPKIKEIKDLAGLRFNAMIIDEYSGKSPLKLLKDIK